MSKRQLGVDCYSYVRNYYHVPAYIGMRVRVKGRDGVLVEVRPPSQYIHILFDGDTRVSGPYHPTDSIVYLVDSRLNDRPGGTA